MEVRMIGVWSEGSAVGLGGGPHDNIVVFFADGFGVYCIENYVPEYRLAFRWDVLDDDLVIDFLSEAHEGHEPARTNKRRIQYPLIWGELHRGSKIAPLLHIPFRVEETCSNWFLKVNDDPSGCREDLERVMI